MIHGFEWADDTRTILAYLWHFEKIHHENPEEEKNLKIFKGFLELMKQYKDKK